MASRPGAFAPEDEQAPSAEEHVVVFRLGQEYYALDIQAVQEIVRIQPTTSIPGAEPWVEGIELGRTRRAQALCRGQRIL